MTDRPEYVPRRFTGAQDHYDGRDWERLYEGFDLDDGFGIIQCAGCGDDLHACAGSEDDPGYNEHIGNGYIMYNYEVAICGACLYEKFPSIRKAIDEDPHSNIDGDWDK